MRKIIMAVCVCAIAALSSGCASMLAVNQRNQRVSIMQAEQRNGRAFVGLNLLAITPGYLALWRETPGVAASATAVDLVTAAVAAWGIKELKDISDNSKAEAPKEATPAQVGTVNIAGDHNTVTINPTEEAAK